VGDTDTEAVRSALIELTHCFAHDRQLLLSHKYVMVIRVRITLSKKRMNFDVIFCNSYSNKMIKLSRILSFTR